MSTRGSRHVVVVTSALGAAAAAVELLAPVAALRIAPALLALCCWAAAALLARRSRRLDPVARTPWRLLTAAGVLLGAGQAMSAAVAAGVNTVGGWPDLPLVAAVPLGLLATLRMLPRARSGFGPRAVLDGGIVLVAVVVLADLLLGDTVGGARFVVAGLISVGYPAVGGVLCGIGLAVLTAVPAGRRPAAARLLGAHAALTVVAVSGAVAMARPSALLDVVTVLAWLCMLALGVCAASVDSPPAPDRAAGEPGGLSLAGVVASHCTAFGVSLLVAGSLVLDRPVSPMIAGETALLLLLTLGRSLVWGVDAHRLTRRLRQAEVFFRDLLHSDGHVTLVLDRDGRVRWTSGDVPARLGWPALELVGQVLATLVHAEDRTGVQTLLAGLAADRSGTAAVPVVIRLRPARGPWRDVEIVAASGGAPGAPHSDGVVLRLRDVTERRRSEQELERMAYTDYLTGLPNRARLMAALDTARARVAAGGEACLLMLDLDGFKPVNDVAGHDAGDELLVQVAGRLRATIRDQDLVSWLGGDEFAVLVPAGLAEATALAERIVAELRGMKATTGGRAGELVLAVSGSVGVAALHPADDVATTIRQADLALRAAKAAGKGCVRRHSEAADDGVARRVRLSRDLPVAIENGQLRLVFQPVAGAEERRILGIEALVRWDHPVLGPVPPEEFVPLAEDDGLIVPLQRWVLGAATAALAPLLAEGRDLKLGVNISVRHLQAGCLAPDVARALAESGVPGHRLMVELTESVLMSTEDRFEGDLATLREMGCVLSLDDFGKGYSSMARLARLPVDVLKMDREFVAHIDSDGRAAALVGSVVDLGRVLGLDVVAEGVETPGQLAALRRLGCRFLQGYLLGRPVPVEELRAAIDGFDPRVLDAIRPTECVPAVHSVGRLV